ncbi:hypothetical protein QQF64_031484 [Cirrhinus molitorella]|uniref:Integrase catalytic domain-containing protein n=1 Tax=Cirrhinus molitorella TaxID=172907 RepID=A0ABR3MX27_9TELE
MPEPVQVRSPAKMATMPESDLPEPRHTSSDLPEPRHVIFLMISLQKSLLHVSACTPPPSSAPLKLKALFAHHRVPEVLVTDSGPQFSASDFADFAKDYDFHHVTSRPHYPQSNGEAERAVRTVKALLRKGEDPHKALMAYRATPLASGASPAQLLMGRNIRTTLPVNPSTLKLAWPNLSTFKKKDKDLKEKQAQWYNKRHRVQAKPALQTAQSVWIKNLPNPGRVTNPADTPCSYIVERQNADHHYSDSGPLLDRCPANIRPAGHRRPTTFFLIVFPADLQRQPPHFRQRSADEPLVYLLFAGGPRSVRGSLTV